MFVVKGVAENWVIVSEDGEVFVMDYELHYRAEGFWLLKKTIQGKYQIVKSLVLKWFPYKK